MPACGKTNRHGRELVNHGTSMFPVGCYSDNLAEAPVPWHWHEELELFLIYKGTATVGIGSKRFLVREGQGFFVNTGVLHSVRNAGQGECRLHSLVFHPRLVGGSMDSILWQRYVTPLMENVHMKALFLDGESSWHQAALQNIEAAWQAMQDTPVGYEFTVRSALSAVVVPLSGHQPVVMQHPSEKALRDSKRIKLMLEFIQQHYAEPITTGDIARSASISESECLRCFRSTIGASPIQYVKQYRIHKATELLTYSQETVSEVGGLCGFPDTSYFIKSFREMKGCTPLEYRRQTAALE